MLCVAKYVSQARDAAGVVYCIAWRLQRMSFRCHHRVSKRFAVSMLAYTRVNGVLNETL